MLPRRAFLSDYSDPLELAMASEEPERNLPEHFEPKSKVGGDD